MQNVEVMWRRNHLDIGWQIKDLSELPRHLHLFFSVSIFLEDVNVRDDVECKGMLKDLGCSRRMFGRV
jgi:hypothetical protein